MRQTVRISGALLIGAGVLGLAWALVVWQWQDPITALYTTYQQHKLAESYEATVAAYEPTPVVPVPAKPHQTQTVNVKAEQRQIALEAARYRSTLEIGGPVGRLRIPRLGLSIIVVTGTDESSLEKGPGLVHGHEAARRRSADLHRRPPHDVSGAVRATSTRCNTGTR